MIPERLLGSTGLKISEMGFGSWAIGGNSYGTVHDQDSLRALEVALDKGIHFIDTADVYGKGHSEELIGRAIQKYPRDQVVIATKAGWDFYHGLIRRNFDLEYLSFALEESLKRLKTDYIDLFQLHNPFKEMALNPALLAALKKLQQSGKIRFYGVSVHGSREARFWIEHTDVQTVQVAFHLLDQEPRTGLFPLIEKEGRGLIVREPLACGILTEKYGEDFLFPKSDHRRRWPKEKLRLDAEKIKKLKSCLAQLNVPLFQIALEFVLSFSQVSVVIPGMKSEVQVRSNLKAVKEKKLAASLIQDICRLYTEDNIFKQGLYQN